MPNSDQNYEKCRPNCGACCIAISISSPIPGMPNGKKAGEPCIHLRSDFTCNIYDSSDRPEVCRGFNFDPLVCGSNRDEALMFLSKLEAECSKEEA